MSGYAREIDVASALAREAGTLAVALRDRGPEALGVEHKAGDEPVTVADRAASELIVRGLAAAFPDAAPLEGMGPDLASTVLDLEPGTRFAAPGLLFDKIEPDLLAEWVGRFGGAEE